jgi:hypothetical protein
MVKTTPVNTRALLLILDTIENNAEVEAKPHSVSKSKEAESKCKTELIDSCTPQKPKHMALVISSAPYVRNMVGHTNHTTLMTVTSSIPTVLLSTGMGEQEDHEEMEMWTSTIQIRENTKGKILPR